MAFMWIDYWQGNILQLGDSKLFCMTQNLQVWYLFGTCLELCRSTHLRNCQLSPRSTSCRWGHQSRVRGQWSRVPAQDWAGHLHKSPGSWCSPPTPRIGAADTLDLPPIGIGPRTVRGGAWSTAGRQAGAPQCPGFWTCTSSSAHWLSRPVLSQQLGG